MQDIEKWIERLRVETEELSLISKLTTNTAKRNVFKRLAETHKQMADDLEKLLKAR